MYRKPQNRIKVFEEFTVEVLGIDVSYVDKNLFYTNSVNFITHDLRKT